MRLWSQQLIPLLPRQQLLGQHRECCALRGRGWGRKHATVDYVFTHDPAYLIAYHFLIMKEMINRGYTVNLLWRDPSWRGDILKRDNEFCNNEIFNSLKNSNDIIFPEHNETYLQECLDNLSSKGINLSI